MRTQLAILAILSGGAAGLDRAASAAEPPPANTWIKATEGGAGRRCGAVLVPVDNARKMLLFGGEPSKGAYVRAWGPGQEAWSDFAADSPAKRGPGSCTRSTRPPRLGRTCRHPTR